MSLRSKHNEATALVQQMTVEEKASLCSGESTWFLQGVERLGLEPVMVTDGPHGLRKQDRRSSNLELSRGIPATCFPTASALASSWNRKLMHDIGVALGEQCIAEDVAVLLGPGVNMKRHPLCGRNFEYFSEDPLLAGEIAAALINGVQSQGVGTSIKHYAVNNQEWGRMFIDAIVDERTLREIYLPAFEIAVKQAQPWTVMCAYNRVNGTYCGEHDWLLNTVLRDDWGFEGLVVSDWGATNDRVAGVQGGLDLEMPGGGKENDRRVAEAIRNGTLSEADLDRTATRVTSVALLGKDVVERDLPLDQTRHHELARVAAAESAVLLKNENQMLPLSREQSIAIIGAFAKRPRFQGTGSSQVKPTRVETAYEALSTSLGVPPPYAAGYDPETDETDEALVADAVELARSADVAVVFAGLPTIYESEGFDRTHMRMPPQHNRLIEAVCEANPRTVVVLLNGSPVEMPWVQQPAAILEMYLAGQAGGQATVDLLLGDANPSGKLAETFPLALDDVPAHQWFPGEHRQVQYREGLYIGYRYFQSFDVPVLYPFGHGLSYTDFEYDNLECPATCDIESESLSISAAITNIGDVSGAEVVQVYVSAPDSDAYRPRLTLATFAKLHLQPGEIGEARFELPARAFAIYDADAGEWVVEAGTYEICVAASSADIRLRANVQISSSQTLSESARVDGPQYEGGTLSCSDDAFADMLMKPVPEPESPTPYHANSTLKEISETAVGARFAERATRDFMKQIGGASDPTLIKMFEEMAHSMPLRALTLFSGGKLTMNHINALTAAANGEYPAALKHGWAVLRDRD